MDSKVLIDGLLFYIGLVVLLTFHEYGHAWMALKCGDATAKNEGRCSLNPLVHIDPIGTVLIPLIQIFFPGAGMFLVGWAKPVPVNIGNLRNPRVDDILISLAGPWMNLLLAVALIGLARLLDALHVGSMVPILLQTAQISLLLCFFNLIPIPPLDGSHVVRSLIGMSYETYWQFARYGFILVLIAIQIPYIMDPVMFATKLSYRIIGSWFGLF